MLFTVKRLLVIQFLEKATNYAPNLYLRTPNCAHLKKKNETRIRSLSRKRIIRSNWVQVHSLDFNCFSISAYAKHNANYFWKYATLYMCINKVAAFSITSLCSQIHSQLCTFVKSNVLGFEVCKLPFKLYSVHSTGNLLPYAKQSMKWLYKCASRTSVQKPIFDDPFRWKCFQ